MRDREDRCSLNVPLVGLVIVPSDSMFRYASAGEHGSVRRKRDAGKDRLGGERIGAASHQRADAGNIGLKQAVRAKSVDADNHHPLSLRYRRGRRSRRPSGRRRNCRRERRGEAFGGRWSNSRREDRRGREAG